MNHILITGGTRGLGWALAAEFLRAGNKVYISGRTQAAVDAALVSLAAATGKNGSVFGGTGDVGLAADLERLGKEGRLAMGGLDMWINNAGINQEPGMIWEVPAENIERVIRTDLTGAMFGGRAAMLELKDSGGSIWFVEGHGSDGRIMDGLSVYGTAKRGLRYLWSALAREARDTKVRVGSVSPGIMVTDFIRGNKNRESPEKWRRNVRFFNILADRPETVAAFLVPRMLASTRNGARIVWLGTFKILYRFLTASLARRKVIEE